MYPYTLILPVAWISSLLIMAVRVVTTSLKSAPVALLNEPKIFFNETFFNETFFNETLATLNFCEVNGIM